MCVCEREGGEGGGGGEVEERERYISKQCLAHEAIIKFNKRDVSDLVRLLNIVLLFCLML